MTACDRCDMYEQCTFYTNTGSGAHGILMWRNVSTSSSLPHLGPPPAGSKGWHASGTRGSLPPAVYLGAMQIENENVTGVASTNSNAIHKIGACRQQGHIATSPINIQVLGEQVSSKGKQTPVQKCNSGDLDGYWKHVDLSVSTTSIVNPNDELNTVCPLSTMQDLEFVRIAGDITVMSNIVVQSKNVTLLFDKKTKSYFFRVDEGSSSSYQWSKPDGFPSEIYGDLQQSPSFQSNPRCGLSSNPIPSEYNSHISYPTVSEQLYNYEWVPTDGSCAYAHYTKGEMRSCLLKHQIDFVYVSGDSVMGGIAAMFKFLVGAHQADAKKWYSGMYSNAMRHSIVTATASMQDNKNVTVANLHLPDLLMGSKKLPNLANSLIIVNHVIHHIMWHDEYSAFTKQMDDFVRAIKSHIQSNFIKKSTKIVWIGPNAIHGFGQVIVYVMVFNEILCV